jgi:hypothetical protein
MSAGVVGPVSHHENLLAGALQFFHHADFAGREQIGSDLRDAHGVSYRSRVAKVVAGHKDDPAQAEPPGPRPAHVPLGEGGQRTR